MYDIWLRNHLRAIFSNCWRKHKLIQGWEKVRWEKLTPARNMKSRCCNNAGYNPSSNDPPVSRKNSTCWGDCPAFGLKIFSTEVLALCDYAMRKAWIKLYAITACRTAEAVLRFYWSVYNHTNLALPADCCQVCSWSVLVCSVMKSQTIIILTSFYISMSKIAVIF